jgi:peroxiredoxin Q/BCP
LLKIGDIAPDFNEQDQNGNTITLSSKKGKWVVLYFYPKDMTPGCTTEACNFQEHLPDISALNAEIIGVSKDSISKHKKFADKYNLNFTLVSDINGKICDAYGVWKEKSLYGKSFMGIVRTTYIIDSQGVVRKIFPKVQVKEHHLEIQQSLQELQNS